MAKLMGYNEIDVKDVDSLLSHPGWDMQQKIDGIRARLVADENDGVEVLNSAGSGLVSTTAAPVVEMLVSFGEYLVSEGRGGCIAIDGEIVNGEFWAFDIVQDDVEDTTASSPWIKRRANLNEFMTEWADHLPWFRQVPSFSSPTEKRAAWEVIKNSGAEGAIFKHNWGTVNDGDRVDHVLKAKIRHTIDVFVLERGPGNGKNGSGNSLSFGLYKKDGSIYEAGRCSFIGKPYAVPGDVIEVKYLYAGAGGRLVQPTHLHNRPDKTPQDCTTEQLHFVSKRVVQLTRVDRFTWIESDAEWQRG